VSLVTTDKAPEKTGVDGKSMGMNEAGMENQEERTMSM